MLSVGASQTSLPKNHTQCLLELQALIPAPENLILQVLCKAEESPVWGLCVHRNFLNSIKVKCYKWEYSEKQLPFFYLFSRYSVPVLDTTYFLHWLCTLTIHAYTRIIIVIFFTHVVVYYTHCFAFCFFYLVCLSSSLFTQHPPEEHLFPIICFLSNVAITIPYLCHFTPMQIYLQDQLLEVALLSQGISLPIKFL